MLLLLHIEGSHRDVKLRNGTLYSNVLILFKNDLGIGFDYDNKTVFVDYSELDPGLLASFEFDLEAYRAARLKPQVDVELSHLSANGNQDLRSKFRNTRELTLRSGKIYKSVNVKRKEPLGVTIQYEDGITFIDYSQLAPEILPEFGFSKDLYDLAKSEREKAAKDNHERQLALLLKSAPSKGIQERDYSQSSPIVSRDYSGERYQGKINTSGPVHVKGYTRKDGTYVRPHTRSR
ncbi:MAG: hypothetical protein QM811_06230 [Pirellulales bacterium]